MSISVDVYIACFGGILAIGHVEVCPSVSEGRTVAEGQTAQVMVGIEAIGFVIGRNAVGDDMHGCLLKLDANLASHAVSSAFESVAVGELLLLAIDDAQAIFVGDAIDDFDGSLGIDEVVAIIAVIPGTASYQHIVLAVQGAWMASEPIAVAALSAFRETVVVVVGIAIDEIVVGTSVDEIESSSHAIMRSDVLQDVVRTIRNPEVLALGMFLYVYWYAYGLNIFDS